MTSLPPNPDNDYLAAHAQLLIASYRHWFGAELLPPAASPAETARRLFEAEFAVLSHDTGPEPMFNYANRSALALFEMDWRQLLATPSRASAEAVKQEERDRIMAQVSAQGYIDDYAGIRVSRNGRRFRIENARVWNLVDPENGGYAGQAAAIPAWRFL
ncbi:MEKHLA domain-containing protein [Methylogaea oryzae]|uniref:MEKHLA domain-containing protein n=1 Tax=Methylogaea oryzae TaxID=1295382 RepID=A0A8D5AMM5_9GAMM|nr:MEKHLA domain-containing protein [Methylogaea oryzae]BBL71235.1 MEKHLA domain-containing protein [Methylogaea oryzae]